MAALSIQSLRDYVEGLLGSSADCFLVKAEIRPASKEVVVEIDSDSRVDIDFVASLSRNIEAEFAPDIDAYDLEVGSAGLTSPLLLPRQYQKYVGQDLEVTASDGKKYRGLLRSADAEGFTLFVEEKVKKEGEKRPALVQVEKHFAYPDVRRAVYDLKF